MNSENTLVDELKTSIAEYLRHRSGVSIIELSRDIDGFAGDKAWGNNEKNIVFWDGMSEQAIPAMSSLIAECKIIPTITNPLVYAYDGGMLNLPLAKRLISSKNTRWLPLVFAGSAA